MKNSLNSVLIEETIEKYFDQTRVGKLDPYTRELMLKVLDGESRMVPVMYLLTTARRRADILNWLIKNHLTGQNLYQVFLGEFKGSVLQMTARIVQDLEKNDGIRPLYADKDFVEGNV